VGVAVNESGHDKLSLEVDIPGGLGPMALAGYFSLYYPVGYVQTAEADLSSGKIHTSCIVDP
jgi:hypothetical protein